MKIHRIKQREKEEEINYFASQRPEQRPNATPTARVSKNLEEIFHKVRYTLDRKNLECTNIILSIESFSLLSLF